MEIFSDQWSFWESDGFLDFFLDEKMQIKHKFYKQILGTNEWNKAQLMNPHELN